MGFNWSHWCDNRGFRGGEVRNPDNGRDYSSTSITERTDELMNDADKRELEDLREEVKIWKGHFEDIKKKYYNKRIDFGLGMIKHLTTLGLVGDTLTDTYAAVMQMYDDMQGKE